MSDRLRFTILGCGASPGVPRLGGGDGSGDWGACDPTEPKNRRRRCSLLVERIGAAGITRVLIDTSPDLREQMLAASVDRLDAVLYTHPHADHIHGIDDLRGFYLAYKQRIPVHADAATLQRLHEGFGYCFTTPPGSDYPPLVSGHLVVPGTEMVIEGKGGPLAALAIEQQHGRIKSLGYRIGGLAYSPDVSDLDATALATLSGLDVWIVDALRPQPHPSHFSLSEALDWIARVAPSRAVLTHMHSDLDYATLRRTLPPHIAPAFDGMAIELDAP